MHISLKWLQRYLPDLDQSPETIEEALILLGFEVESITRQGLAPLENVVVGEVLAREPHPNADKLSVCKVNTGDPDNPAGIVCGAKNFKVGDRVPVALVGAVLPGGFTIQAAKLRGVDSAGMMCSARELGLGEDHAGLLILDGRPEVGTPINQVFPKGDVILDVEVTPNRPDCLSHLGIARELAARFNLQLFQPEIRTSASSFSPDATDALITEVSLEAPDRCPYYTAHSIRGVTIAESPAWLKEALTAIGLRPINNVVDVTNFVLHEMGQPLHAFDAAKIRGNRIRVRAAEDQEKLTTLDDKIRTLQAHHTVIADAERALVVAGVMGSVDAEVDASTSDIVLESARFHPGMTRRTSRELGLSTDSSYRFERGVDPGGVLKAAWRAIDLILETAGGKLDQQAIEAGSVDLRTRVIPITADYVRERCGFGPADEEIRTRLSSLHLDVSEGPTAGSWQVGIPSYRGDLERPIDLVEEFLRIHGTDRIPEKPVASTALLREHCREWTLRGEVAQYLRARGFSECYHYTLLDGKKLETTPDAMASLQLLNPISSDQTHLRPSLIPALVGAIQTNQSHGTSSGRFFEWGRVYLPQSDGIVECLGIAFAIQEDPANKQWLSRQTSDFYQVKGMVSDLLGIVGLKLPDPLISLEDSPVYGQAGHFALCRALKQMGVQAEFGMVDLRYLKSQDVEGSVWAACIAILPEAIEKPSKAPRYQAFSHLPPSYKDLALVADASESAVNVQQALSKAARTVQTKELIVEEVRLFDLYQGKGLEEGKKSLAFTLTFRGVSETLKDETVNQAFDAIQASIESRTAYRVRR